MKKINHFLSLAHFKFGKFTFPIFEPLLRFFENKNPEVRQHFNQALSSLNKKKQAIALLNLNMVLSLNPKHFLARIFRGRIYVKEGQYRLASEDYLEANRISQYRFIHYDLHREYFQSVNSEFGKMGDNIQKSFYQVFDTLKFKQEKSSKDANTDMAQKVRENLSTLEASLQEEDGITLQMSPNEKEKFQALGPITQEELEESDWDKLVDDLSNS